MNRDSYGFMFYLSLSFPFFSLYLPWFYVGKNIVDFDLFDESKPFLMLYINKEAIGIVTNKSVHGTKWLDLIFGKETRVENGLSLGSIWTSHVDSRGNAWRIFSNTRIVTRPRFWYPPRTESTWQLQTGSSVRFHIDREEDPVAFIEIILKMKDMFQEINASQ